MGWVTPPESDNEMREVYRTSNDLAISQAKPDLFDTFRVGRPSRG